MTPRPVEYPTSGGTSEVLPYDPSERVAIELHEGFFSIVWSAQIAAEDFMRRVIEAMPDASDAPTVLQPSPNGRPDYPFHDALHRIEQSPDHFFFVRVDAQKEALTWQAGTDSLLPEEARLGNVAVIASSFSREFLEPLIEQTATPQIVADIAGIMDAAQRVTDRLKTRSA